MTLFLYGVSGNLFSIGNSLATKLGHLGLALLAVGVAAAAFVEVMRHRPFAALALVVVAAIPAFFFADSHAATHMLTSTVNSL